MSLTQQCVLLGVARSSYYHRTIALLDSSEEELMQVIDRLYMQQPTFRYPSYQRCSGRVRLQCWT